MIKPGKKYAKNGWEAALMAGLTFLHGREVNRKMGIRKNIVLLIFFFGVILGGLATVYWNSMAREDEGISFLFLAHAYASKGETGRALANAYALTTLEGQRYSGFDIVGDLHFCLREYSSAIINYDLALQAARKELHGNGIAQLIGEKIQLVSDGKFTNGTLPNVTCPRAAPEFIK